MMGNAASVIGFAVAGIVIFFVAVKVDLSILRLVFLPLEFAGTSENSTFGFPELILHYLERHLKWLLWK